MGAGAPGRKPRGELGTAGTRAPPLLGDPAPSAGIPLPSPLDSATAEQRVQKRDVTWIREARAGGWLSEFLDRYSAFVTVMTVTGLRGGVDGTLFEIALK